MKKKIIIILLFILAFAVRANAQETDVNDYLKEQGELLGVEGLSDNLPEEIKSYYDENGINPMDGDWINTIEKEGVLSHIGGFLKNGAKIPFSSAGLILAVILTNAAINTFKKNETTGKAVIISSVCCAAAIITPIISMINAAVESMKTAAGFMAAFIPVFATVVAAGGGAVTSVSMSGLLIFAANAVEFIANGFVTPLICGYLAVSVSSGVSPLLADNSLAEGIKKIAVWILTLSSTVFVGFLSIQTAVNVSADSLTMKTAKFVLGTSVPIAGTALAEAFSTVTASISMIKTSVAVYGVISCAAIFLPILAEMVFWRIVLNLSSVLAKAFSLGKISALLKSTDSAISVLLTLVLITFSMFSISLSVVASAVKI